MGPFYALDVAKSGEICNVQHLSSIPTYMGMCVFVCLLIVHTTLSVFLLM